MARDLHPRTLVRQVTDRMSEHDVRTYATRDRLPGAHTSLIPLALLVIAVAVFLEVEELWTDDLAPQFEAHVSEEVYAVADEVVRRTLGDEQLFWLTVGLVFTLCQTSGAARAIMGVLSDVYNHGEDRSFRRRSRPPSPAVARSRS